MGGTFAPDLVPGFPFFAVGMGLIFITSIIAATAGVSDEEQGLASGLINTSRQVGVTILPTIAAARADGRPRRRLSEAIGSPSSQQGPRPHRRGGRPLDRAARRVRAGRGPPRGPGGEAAFLAECRQSSRV